MSTTSCHYLMHIKNRMHQKLGWKKKLFGAVPKWANKYLSGAPRINLSEN
jgi:hypothetical protein